MHIVTGGAGFIGSAVVWELNRRGVEDIVVVDNLARTEKWKNLVNRRYADYLHRDVFIDLARRDALPWPVTAVFHLGACSSTTETDADFLMENNFRYSRDLCRFALDKGARFINASSAATYGDGSRGFSDDPAGLGALRPLNMYGYSKHLFDLWLQREGLLHAVASLKFFNVYGPNEYHKAGMRSVICKAFGQIRETGVLRLFRSDRPDYADGEQKRDFVYVKDCTALMLWLLDHPEINGVRNVGTGAARTWNDLASAVFRAMDLPRRVEYVDLPEELRGRYQYYTAAETDRLKADACPVAFASLEDGVDDYVRNYLAASDPYL